MRCRLSTSLEYLYAWHVRLAGWLAGWLADWLRASAPFSRYRLLVNRQLGRPTSVRWGALWRHSQVGSSPLITVGISYVCPKISIKNAAEYRTHRNYPPNSDFLRSYGTKYEVFHCLVCTCINAVVPSADTAAQELFTTVLLRSNRSALNLSLYLPKIIRYLSSICCTLQGVIAS